jgi:hypothetical protein
MALFLFVLISLLLGIIIIIVIIIISGVGLSTLGTAAASGLSSFDDR